MAINRNSEEKNGVGSSGVSFLNGFQTECSASSALAKKGFSLKLHGGGRMKNRNLKDLKLQQRWKLRHHAQTINNNNTRYHVLSSYVSHVLSTASAVLS